MTPSRTLADKATAAASQVLSHTNCNGVTFYLHKGQTKTGKPRYFVAKTVRKGAITTMPEGFEFSESINGVVSVRRSTTGKPKIPDTDLAMARAELARHPHLARYRVEETNGAIVVFEPKGGVDPSIIADLAQTMFVSPEFIAAQFEKKLARTKYDPVMKLVPSGEQGHYTVHRMTYRGDGGWSYPLATKPLQALLKKYIKHVGTDDFFNLM
ncbi:MAG: hypothetical protein KAI66_27495 [Lentisphaeria bacterium]|nr:hypothetical protein [Lentisphaeria bacterium]